MKRILLIIASVLILVWILSQFQGPVGTYVAKYNVNITDTLIINDDNSFEQFIYSKKNNELIFKNKGEWKYKDGSITFFNFLPTSDDERLLKENYNIKEDLMSYGFPLDVSFGRVVISYDEITARYYYYKLFY